MLVLMLVVLHCAIVVHNRVGHALIRVKELLSVDRGRVVQHISVVIVHGAELAHTVGKSMVVLSMCTLRRHVGCRLVALVVMLLRLRRLLVVMVRVLRLMCGSIYLGRVLRDPSSSRLGCLLRLYILHDGRMLTDHAGCAMWCRPVHGMTARPPSLDASRCTLGLCIGRLIAVVVAGCLIGRAWADHRRIG